MDEQQKANPVCEKVWFKSYHIIIFKFPIFNNKTYQKHTKKWESMTHSEKQNRETETIPEEVKTLHLLEKQTKNNYLKYAPYDLLYSTGNATQ